MIEAYRHTQFASAALIPLSMLFALMIALAVLIPEIQPFGPVLLIPVVVLALFLSLTVVIRADSLTVHFGPGVFGKTWTMEEIESWEVIRIPWYYGWGLRWTPRGWLYKVSGPHGLALKLKSGKTYQIGTDDPDALAKALEIALTDHPKS